MSIEEIITGGYEFIFVGTEKEINAQKKLCYNVYPAYRVYVDRKDSEKKKVKNSKRYQHRN